MIQTPGERAQHLVRLDSVRGSFYLSSCSHRLDNLDGGVGGDLNSEARSDDAQKPLQSRKSSTYGACSFGERASVSGTRHCLTERD